MSDRSKGVSILIEYTAMVGLGFVFDFAIGLGAPMFVAALALFKAIKLEWEAKND